jgi:plasmid stability protein
MWDVSKMLQVRDVPDDVHAELRRRAAAAGMSLSEFALQELARLARRPTVAELLDRAAARPGDRMSFADAREAVTASRPSE